MAKVQMPCFDFEYQYLKDVISWGDELCDPDVLLPKFADNEFDGNIVYLIFSGLQVVVTMATCVAGSPRAIGGKRFEMSHNMEEDGWQMTKDGRIWSGSELEIVTTEKSVNDSKKLAKLLKSQIEATSKLKHQRKAVLKAFEKFETEKVKKSSSQKNKFSKAQKLDVEVQKYLKLMQSDGQLRRQIIQKLEPDTRRLSTRHKQLLASLIKNLRKFTCRFITDGDEPGQEELSRLCDDISVDSRDEDIENYNLMQFSSRDKYTSPNMNEENRI